MFLLRFSIFTIQGKGFYQAWSNTSHDWNWTVSTLMQDTGPDPFNQNFRKFRSKTQWIDSFQPEKFRKNGSTFWGGPIFLVRLVGILVEWIAPTFFPKYIYCHLKKVTWKLIVISKILKNPLFNPTICPNGSVNSYLSPPPPPPRAFVILSVWAVGNLSILVQVVDIVVFSIFHLKCSYLESYENFCKEYF